MKLIKHEEEWDSNQGVVIVRLIEPSFGYAYSVVFHGLEYSRVGSLFTDQQCNQKKELMVRIQYNHGKHWYRLSLTTICHFIFIFKILCECDNINMCFIYFIIPEVY